MNTTALKKHACRSFNVSKNESQFILRINAIAKQSICVNTVKFSEVVLLYQQLLSKHNPSKMVKLKIQESKVAAGITPRLKVNGQVQKEPAHDATGTAAFLILCKCTLKPLV